MKVLITGGAGFIGGHLVKRFLRHSAEVVVLDNLKRRSIENLTCTESKRIRFHFGDVRDRDALRIAMRGVSTVFHLAAQSNVLGAAANPEYTHSTNVTGTCNVLEEARICGVRRIIFTSSREVYGEANVFPTPEEAAVCPKNEYGASKAEAETHCRSAASVGLEVVILRLANVYGPGDHGRVIPLFFQKAELHHPLNIYGEKKILDFVWVENVVDALVAASLRPVAGQTFNVGSGRGTLLQELAARIINLTNSKSTIRMFPARRSEVDLFVADIARARRDLGHRPDDDPLSHLAAVRDNYRPSEGCPP